MSKIFYNNFLLGASGQADPLVVRNVTPIFGPNGRRIGLTDVYTLIGQITGCQYSDIISIAARVNNIFSKDFGNLQFVDDNGFSATISGCKVNKIDYPIGRFVGLQDYTVELLAYPQQYFENVGILEKRNEWRVSQDDKNNLNITHTIFAKGINTYPAFNNAFDNAKNFVLSYTGLTPPSLFPYFISGFSGSLDSRNESINRLEGTFQIVENYIGSTGSGVTTDISIDIESGTNGIISVGVRGEYRGGKSIDFSVLRQTYNALNSFSLCSGAYLSYRGVTGLQYIPVESGITESYQDNTLSFDIQFNDYPDIFYKHTYQVQITSGNNGIIAANINGNIEGLGRIANKYDNAYNFFKTLNILNLVNVEFVNFVGTSYPYSLRPVPIESGVTIDRFGGIISYEASFDDRTMPITGAGLRSFDITYNKQYATRKVSPLSLIESNQGLDTQDMLFNSRATIEVNGNVLVDRQLTVTDATGFVRKFINNDFQSGVLGTNGKSKIRMDSAQITELINQNGANFSVVFSFDEPIPTRPFVSYSQLTGLAL